MAIERLIFDPDGDLILRLTYPEDWKEDEERGTGELLVDYGEALEGNEEPHQGDGG